MSSYLLLSMLDVGKSRFFSGLVLLYLCVVLPTADAAGAAVLSTYCTNFDNAGGTISLHEGQNNSVTIYTWRKECEDAACIVANTSCTMACAGCAAFDGFVPMTIAGQGVNGSAVPGLDCDVANASSSLGQWPATCFANNSLAGHLGYSLVLVIMDATNATIGLKSVNISFIAGDVVITNCVGSLENGTNKAFLATDNVLQIYLMDYWNNTVGAKTGRTGITPIPFTVTVTWNPDDGSKVSLGQTPTVDTRGDNGYYTAIIIPTKTGNYLAKIGVNTTMILNSPIAFQALKGKKSSASFLRPSFLGSGAWGFCLSAVYMAILSITAGTLM